MAGGQQISIGQGSVTQSEDVALTGQAETTATGTLVADVPHDVTLALSGDDLDATAGTIAAALSVRLRSRKVGGGTASRALSGSSMSTNIGSLSTVASRTPTGQVASFSQGAFTKSRTRLLTGSSYTISRGTMTASSTQGPNWIGVIPTVSFTQGSSGTYDLTQHTISFDPVEHRFEVGSGTLPTGVTLNQTSGYVYNGTSPVASASNVVVNIVDILTIPPDPATLTGLDFPSNTGTVSNANSVRFKFTGSALPAIYGTGGTGLTYLFKYKPRQQTGYYTTFFWANDDGQGNINTFNWDGGGSNTYYGMHPYPNPPPSGTAHVWEIAVEANDYPGSAVVKDVWYSQCVKVSGASGAAKSHQFYWDLPNVDSGHYVTRTSPSTYGNTMPPSPALTFGDAPWQPCVERCSGILRGIQIWTGNLSNTHMLALADFEGDDQVLAYASANSLTSQLWYLNMNPTPSDISDKSGAAHSPAWFNSNRPTLYSTGIDAAADWTSRSAGAMYAENWNSYATAAAYYNYWNSGAMVGHLCPKNPSMGSTWTNAFEVITTSGHMATGKAFRLYHGKNADSGGEIDNQWLNVLFNGSPASASAPFRTKVYVQVSIWADEFIDYYWKMSDGQPQGAKFFRLDDHLGTNSGEFVLHHRNNNGFVAAYRRNAGGNPPFDRTQNTQLYTNYAIQPAINNANPSSPTTEAQFKQKYGPMVYGMSNGTSQGSLLHLQANTPDPDALIGGVPWNRGGITVVEAMVDYTTQTCKVWAAAHGSAPRLIINEVGTADFGDRNMPNGVGWNCFEFTNLCYTSNTAMNPGRPAASYTDYSELIVSTSPINFPGGFSLP